MIPLIFFIRESFFMIFSDSISFLLTETQLSITSHVSSSDNFFANNLYDHIIRMALYVKEEAEARKNWEEVSW